MEGLVIVIWICSAILYFVPAILAYKFDCKSRLAIAGLNVLFGWTLIGWGLSLVWVLKEYNE